MYIFRGLRLGPDAARPALPQGDLPGGAQDTSTTIIIIVIIIIIIIISRFIKGGAVETGCSGLQSILGCLIT